MSVRHLVPSILLPLVLPLVAPCACEQGTVAGPDGTVPADVAVGPDATTGDGVGWSPAMPSRADRITVWAARPGMLHWGVNGWTVPARALWPAGTTMYDGMSLETPLAGPDALGRHAVTLGPFGDGTVGVLDFVIHHADGSWDNHGGADWHVPVSGGTADAGTDLGGATGDGGVAGAGNPASVGTGARKTIVIDGLNTAGEWGADTLLIRDPAADDARFLGTNWCAHEAPWDYAALHAAWDDTNLYVGLQYVNVTDVVDPANLGSSAGNALPAMDLVQFVAFDTVAAGGYATGGDLWRKDHEFVGPDHPEYQLYFHGNFSQEGTYLGRWAGTAWMATTNGMLTPALRGRGGAFLVGATLPGVDPHADDATPGRYGTLSDYVARGHQGRYDAFFELQIPLSLLGLTAARLDHGAIGLFAGNGDGSGVDSVPDDPATCSTPGVSPSNSPLEWDTVADDDRYTSPFAQVGRP